MNWGGLVIVGSYIVLFAAWGWWGLLAGAAHVAALVWCLPRKPPTKPD